MCMHPFPYTSPKWSLPRRISGRYRLKYSNRTHLNHSGCCCLCCCSHNFQIALSPTSSFLVHHLSHSALSINAMVMPKKLWHGRIGRSEAEPDTNICNRFTTWMMAVRSPRSLAPRKSLSPKRMRSWKPPSISSLPPSVSGMQQKC